MSYLPRAGRRRLVARARSLLVLALVIAALVAFCGHPGSQSAKRQAVPSPSSHGHAPTWAFQYVHFVNPSDGWAMAENDHSGFTDLLTSHDGGRRWHDVTPPLVVASDNAWLYDSSHNRDFENTAGGRIEEAATVQALTPFVLNGRDAWLPVLRSYGQDDQSSEVYLFMTSDAGRRWALRGRFPGAEVLGTFFLSPSNGFIETDEGAASDEDPVQVYATYDGGKQWREVSASPPFNGPGGSPNAVGDYCDKDGVSLPAPASGSPPCTATPGRRTSTVRPTAAVSGMASSSRVTKAMMAPSPTRRCSRRQRSEHGRGDSPCGRRRHHHRRRPPLGP